MMTEPTKQQIMKGVRWESKYPKGGLIAGISPCAVLEHDLFGIRIEMCEYRSQIDNRKHALSLFSHFLDELPPNIINALNKEYGEDDKLPDEGTSSKV
jgi:hypothetical protein